MLLSINQLVQAMKDTKFKTTIKCSGCVDKVTPFLNEAVGVGNWDVDLNNPMKVLTVRSEVDQSKDHQSDGKSWLPRRRTEVKFCFNKAG